MIEIVLSTVKALFVNDESKTKNEKASVLRISQYF